MHYLTYSKTKFSYLGSVQLDNELIGVGFIKFETIDIDTYGDKLFIPWLYGRWSAYVELTAESADLPVWSLNAGRRIGEGKRIIIG